MRLSVIIATRNRVRFLRGQLEALCRQEWPGGWEVIVADNGSRDDTAEVVRSYSGRLPGLRLLDASAVPGTPYAQNQAARVALGDAFLFVDDDDEVGEGWLTAMGRALTEHPFVAARIDASKLNAPWLLGSRSSAQRHGLQQIPYPPYLAHAAGATLGVRRSTFEAVGGFDETLLAVCDTFFCLRVQLMGVPLQFVPDAVVHMRFRTSLRGMYGQARGYGQYSTLMYRKMRELGMPPLPHPIRESLGKWWYIVRCLPGLRRKSMWGHLAFHLGYRMGRLRGSLKHRVLAP